MVLLIITFLFQIHCHISGKQARTQNTVVRANYSGPRLKVVSWVVFCRSIAVMRVFKKVPIATIWNFFVKFRANPMLEMTLGWQSANKNFRPHPLGCGPQIVQTIPLTKIFANSLLKAQRHRDLLPQNRDKCDSHKRQCSWPINWNQM